MLQQPKHNLLQCLHKTKQLHSATVLQSQHCYREALNVQQME